MFENNPLNFGRRNIDEMYDPKEYCEVALSKSAVIRKDPLRPSQTYLDVVLPNAEKDFDILLFQNFYTSSLSVTQQGGTGPIAVLDNYCLMPDAYSESGAQSWFVIEAAKFNAEFTRGKPIRITLFQPSAQWHKFEIKNLKALVKIPSSTNAAAPEPKSKTLDSISEMLWADYKVLYEASRNTHYSGSLPDTVYVYSENRKSSKRKDKRKKSTMAMTNNPSSNSFV